ncbi:hypothetical protein GCK72_005414 [Caenorhabditis remanei]|uniref:Tetratricopeptide SHNi-TPR domain-containing protein n=1 Tax=Caenorhabditis remanei TaxID=31234 RepID=A0A6A5HHC8_CAERE|nr:hypothetical protein GCK72_005414 [Caenorhabditis remanei]KAF1765462.1 hypothetical protein GCK72_005414 [Caenorhabditis remanei]
MSTEDIIDQTKVSAGGDEPEKENSEPTQEEKEKRLAELVANGRRELRVNNNAEASEILSEAAELSVEIYGEGHENTFDACYYYGMASLEVAKLESALLKNPDEKQRNGVSGDEEAASGDEEEKTAEDENDDGSEKEDGEESEDGDEDSMKLAWELLETARCTAAAKIEALEAERSGVQAIEQWNLKLADVLILLGDHGIADENYEQAREDLGRALGIQQNILPPSSRIIAQTYILMASACSSSMNFTDAVTFYKRTKDTLVAREEELKKQLPEIKDKEKKSEIEDELKELEEMIPGIDEMINDANASAEQVEQTTKEIKAQFAGFTTILSKLPQETEEKEVNDISNLVRRPAKRQTETTDINTDTTKKTKSAEKEEENSQI